MDRMRFLVDELKKHAYNYYVLDNPTISDSEYDKLYDELLNLEKETGIVFPDSPSQRVGGITTLKGFKKFEHKNRLYSLDKVTDIEDLKKFVNDISNKYDTEFSLEYKLDGLTIVLVYQNGILVKAGTRGNGFVGEEVTNQVKTIQSIPLTINFKEELIIHGECMMSEKSLKEYNKNATEPLKNTRNGVAGAIRNLNVNETAKRKLDFFAFGIEYIENQNFTQKEQYEFLQKLGFKVNPFIKYFNSIEEVLPDIKKIGEEKANYNYQIDGVVVKVNGIQAREKLGYTNKFPKWAMAFKFPAEEVSTTLLDVVWQVGRTGKVTPLAILKPVYVAGATVKKTTLNNYEDILRKKVKINDRVFIRRSNEVIPEILGVAESYNNSINVELPVNCPVCGSKLEKIGPNVFCPNKQGCDAQIIERLIHFCSKEAMDIEGLSEKTLTTLYETYGLKNNYEIYNITNEMLLKLDKFKELKTKNILQAIEKSKNCNLSNFIYSLGILNVGVKTAKDLESHFKSLDNLINASYEELRNIKDIGDVVAECIINFFKQDKTTEDIKHLFEAGVKINKVEEKLVNNNFFEKTFVLTGTLASFTRDEATKIIENFGGNVSGSVSKNTYAVIVGENAGSKLDKAKVLGIKVLSEEEFKDLIKK